MATHRKSKTVEYRAWLGIKTRCYNPKNPAYRRYGGRGIRVCDRWMKSFEAFFSDMGPRPNGTSIDRIDNDSWYSPENCRWANATTQHNNQLGQMKGSLDFGDERKLPEWLKDVSVDLSPGWRSYQASNLPFGCTALGVISHSGRYNGALVRTGVGYFQLNAGTLRAIPSDIVEPLIQKAAVAKLPQITGARGGRAGTGTAKVRGDSSYYAALRKKRKS